MRTTYPMSLITASAFSFSVSTYGEGFIIYDNRGPTGNCWPGSDVGLPFFIADGFVLEPGLNTITHVNWWGVYFRGNTPRADDFTIDMYAEAIPSVSPVISPDHSINFGSVRRMDTGMYLESFQVDVYEYWADIDPVTLTPGIRYYLSIHNDTTSSEGNIWHWMPAPSLIGEGTYDRNNFSSAWNGPFGAEWAFNLEASLHEPGAFLLLGTSILGVAVFRKKAH